MMTLISPVATTSQLATIETGALVQFSGTIAVGFFIIGLLTVIILTLAGLITVVRNSFKKTHYEKL